LVVFLVVVAAFFVDVVAAASFFVVAAVELDVVLVVVIDSFLLAHDVIKPRTARTAMDVIRDCFISVVVNERPECPAGAQSASIN
jgi:Na+/H+-dicarboxylate symporter